MGSSCKITASLFLGGCLVSLLCISSSAYSGDMRPLSAPDYNVSTASLSDHLTTYNYNMLYLVWPGTYCTSIAPRGCCKPTTGNFVQDFYVWAIINYKTPTIVPCYNWGSCVFNLNGIADLLPSLHYYWPNLACPSNDGTAFWQQVWCGYGTCTSLNQHAYFQNGIQLASQIKPLWFLQQKGIVPTTSRYYRLSQIQDALVPDLGDTFIVECEPTKTWLLYRIDVCVNADATRRISCPPVWRRSNCQDYIYFPPYSFSVNGEENVVVDFVKMPIDRS